MRIAVLASLLFISSLVNAQSWCPPGATWTYTHTNNWTHDGFARYQYTGDTMIAGTNAQIISMHAEGYDFSMQTNFNWGGRYFTSVSGEVVNLWTGAAFDTLFNGADVGAEWQMNLPDGIDPFILIGVVDTGNITIDGVPLHYLVTTLNGIGADTIVERLGTIGHQLVPWSMGITDQLDGPLRCYQDNDIDYQRLRTYGCESA
ncbi:MAG: hypothetical protein IPP33_15205 [Flavobacteriales bacterium]|nr:hypothetical protein [Flavobacteriales bacterium]